MAHIAWGPNERYRLALGTVFLTVLVIGALFVWPTPYRYWSNGDRIYRQQRFTACFEYATDSGWSRPPKC